MTIALLADLAGEDVMLSRADGAAVRTAAMGTLFMLAGLEGVTRRARAVGLAN